MCNRAKIKSIWYCLERVVLAFSAPSSLDFLTTIYVVVRVLLAFSVPSSLDFLTTTYELKLTCSLLFLNDISFQKAINYQDFPEDA